MEIQRADRQLRKRIFLGVLLAAVAGVVGLVAVQSWLSELLRRPPAAGTKQATLVAVLAWSIGVTCLLLVGLAVYVWRFGNRIRTAMQFPPPRAHVIRDTIIVRGAAAAGRASILQAIAIVLGLCAVGLLAATWRLLSLLGAHAA
jgi:hypothetical protein